MNVGVLTIDFEIGLPVDRVCYGSIGGTAEIDCDGAVVHITLEPRANRVPLGEFDVPVPRDDSIVSQLANQIEADYDDDIEHRLTEWSVSIAEKQFEPREAAE